MTDALGNTATGTININIVDDVPTATADIGNVNEGALLTVAASGVLSNDVAGADGATINGVRAAGGDTTTAVSGGVGTNIAGLHGTLHLNADGSYTYQSTANNITAATTDVFVYTLKDGDGDLSTTTLTINLANATVLAPTDNDVTVNENALDTTVTPPDLAAGTVTGSLPGSAAETDASNQLNGSGGFGTLTYALVSGGNAATAGTFGTIQVHADGSYVYTLTSPVTEPTANNGTDTVNAAESFTYRVTDGLGNTATGTININIVDDVPSNISPLPATLTNGSGSATAPLDSDTNTDNNYGADGGTVIFAASLNGLDSGLTSNARKIFYQTSNGGHTLTGFADQNLNGVYDPATDKTAIFTINLNLDGSLAIASDTYTVQMLGRVDSATHIDFNSGGYNFVGGNNSWAEFIPANETVANPIDNNSPDLLLTPAVNHCLQVPSIQAQIAAASAAVKALAQIGNLPETFRVDFVTDLRGDPAGSPANYGNPANRDHVFDGHYTVNGSNTDFTGSSGSTINIAAFDDPDGNNIVGDGVKDTITGVVIRFGGSTSGFIDLTQLTNPSPVVGGHTFTITENADGSIDLGGVAGTTSIATFTANGYNSLEYTWVSGDPFKIGNFGTAN